MDSLALPRSKALNNIPKGKHFTKIAEVIEVCEVCSKKSIKVGKSLEVGLCTKCRITVTAFNRYYEANIPIEYWDLKMDKDFVGWEGLRDKYNSYASDIKKAYVTGNSICFAGMHGLGKQLCLETELPTSKGFIKLKDLKEGDELFDENGSVCNVVKLHPIQISPESYEIEFNDGTKIKACADHQWKTLTRKDRLNNKDGSVKTTKEIFNTLFFQNGSRSAPNHSIPCAKPISYSKKELPIDPYLFGLWLGDGCINNGLIETQDIELLQPYQHHIVPSSIRQNSKSVSVRVEGLFLSLSKLGFIKKRDKSPYKEKYIPNEYLHGSIDQRMELLRGLLDSDGSCNISGGIEFTTVFHSLANDIYQLITSLGIKTKINKNSSKLHGKLCKDRYRLTFTTKLPVFKLKRKLSKIRLSKTQLTRTEHRFIVNIKKIDSVPMRCITVDSDSHLFLITKSFIATHNTMTTTCILKLAAQKGYNCLYTTLSDVVNVLTAADSEEKFLARKELMMVDFLVIDEFDSRFIATDNAADLYARTLETIFRTRSQNKLPTLMCTNSPNILETFSGALKMSLGSLMKGYLKIFAVLGTDHRSLLAKESNQ